MKDVDREDHSDPLAVGLTRPAMRWGVTYSAIVINAMLTMQAFLVTQKLPLLLLALPIHGICVLLCAREPRWFELAALWSKHRLPALARNFAYWRASSYTPVTLDLPRGARCRRRHELMEGPQP